jgi:hypothetical protein
MITSFTVGTLRNNSGLAVGTKFTVGGTGITVTSLGRICVSGNSGSHTVLIANSSGTTLTSATVNMSGCSAGNFIYTTISNYALPASTSYYLTSQESNGGDQWYDATSVTSTAAVTINDACYYSGSYTTIGATGYSYVPVNLKYF